MTDRTIMLRSGLSLVFYLALAGGAVVAQDAPRTELGTRLAENHGDGAFHRLEEVKLRPAVSPTRTGLRSVLRLPQRPTRPIS